MEVNRCLNSGDCRVVKGGLSRGRWRRQAVYWESNQWQVNPLWRKPFIFVKAFLLQIHRGPAIVHQLKQKRRIPSDVKEIYCVWRFTERYQTLKSKEVFLNTFSTLKRVPHLFISRFFWCTTLKGFHLAWLFESPTGSVTLCKTDLFTCIPTLHMRPCSHVYLNERSQQHTAHLLLQDDLVLGVVVAGRDEGGEEHSDEARVAEVLERQLTQFLQHAGLAARLHYHLEQTHREHGQSVTKPVSGTAGCKSPPCAPPTCKSATKTTHKQPLGGDLWGTASHHAIMGYKTWWWDVLFFLCTNSKAEAL